MAAAECQDYDGTMVGAVGTTHYVSDDNENSKPRASLRIQGKARTFLLDTGTSRNLISSHDVDFRQLKLTKPGRKLVMWNGSTAQIVGNACIPVYNPVPKKLYHVTFDVVSARAEPALGCSVVQAMGLVHINGEKYMSTEDTQPNVLDVVGATVDRPYDKDVRHDRRGFGNG